MRPATVVQFAFLTSVLLLTGCSSNNKGKIEGTRWTSNATTQKGKSIPAGALTLNFSSDGKLVYKAGIKTFSGTYSLSMGDTVMMNFDQELAGRKKHAQTVIIEGDRLTMKDSDGTQMIFSKVK